MAYSKKKKDRMILGDLLSGKTLSEKNYGWV